MVHRSLLVLLATLAAPGVVQAEERTAASDACKQVADWNAPAPPVVDTTACRRYAQNAQANLEERIAKEQKGFAR